MAGIIWAGQAVNSFLFEGESLSLGGSDSLHIGDLNTWLMMQHASPLDFVAGCSADMRHLQSTARDGREGLVGVDFVSPGTYGLGA